MFLDCRYLKLKKAKLQHRGDFCLVGHTVIAALQRLKQEDYLEFRAGWAT